VLQLRAIIREALSTDDVSSGCLYLIGKSVLKTISRDNNGVLLGICLMRSTSITTGQNTVSKFAWQLHSIEGTLRHYSSIIYKNQPEMRIQMNYLAKIDLRMVERACFIRFDHIIFYNARSVVLRIIP
jgi:hypothetical protein